MTIPLKKSRPIEVDGVKYRWMAKYSKKTADVPSAVHITIQEEGNSGVLQCVAVEKHCPWDEDRKPAVYPSDIERLIHFGLEKGWKGNKGVFRPGPIELEEFTAI